MSILFTEPERKRFRALVGEYDHRPIDTWFLMTHCASRNDVQIVKWLCESGSPIRKGAIWAACEEGHLELLKFLASNGCPLTFDLLQSARFYKQHAIIEWLIAQGYPRRC